MRSRWPERRAVVDIGSNSVRLVVYDGPRRAPSAICNEKALCGRGRDIAPAGALIPAAVDAALPTLARFRRLIDEYGDPPTHVIATAAVRDASDGAGFVDRVRNLGLAVEVIGGEREAALAAMGALSYSPDATGVVGDLGGGSLELTAVDGGRIGESVSLGLGPLRLMQDYRADRAAAMRRIQAEIDAVDWLQNHKGGVLYAVGGAWRAIARIKMRLRNYPLPVLQGYEMDAGECAEVCELIAHQSPKSLEEIPGVQRRRIDTLPFAALVLKAALARSGAARVAISAGGVREGLLHEALSEAERGTDPLLAGAAFLAGRLSPDPEFGAAVAAFTAPLFVDENPRLKSLCEATCALIDAAAFFHPDLRGLHAFDVALRAPFFAISHAHRVAMAIALFVRHEGKRASLPESAAIGLAPWRLQQRAVQLGLAMRFAAALAPKAPGVLASCSLALDGGELRFSAPRRLESLMADMPRRRLQSLAEAFDAKPVERYEDETPTARDGAPVEEK